MVEEFEGPSADDFNVEFVPTDFSPGTLFHGSELRIEQEVAVNNYSMFISSIRRVLTLRMLDINIEIYPEEEQPIGDCESRY